MQGVNDRCQDIPCAVSASGIALYPHALGTAGMRFLKSLPARITLVTEERPSPVAQPRFGGFG